MSMDDASWVNICALDEIVPNTGVCALVGDRQVAVFRVVAAPDELAPASVSGGSMVFAISNYDPNANAAVLSRGLIGNLGDRLVVASPIYKQHFDLRTGECLEAPENAVARFDAQVRDGHVWVQGHPTVDAAMAMSVCAPVSAAVAANDTTR
jgi:nitrite reductase (NADH) small subunit